MTSEIYHHRHRTAIIIDINQKAVDIMDFCWHPSYARVDFEELGIPTFDNCECLEVSTRGYPGLPLGGLGWDVICVQFSLWLANAFPPIMTLQGRSANRTAASAGLLQRHGSFGVQDSIRMRRESRHKEENHHRQNISSLNYRNVVFFYFQRFLCSCMRTHYT